MTAGEFFTVDMICGWKGCPEHFLGTLPDGWVWLVAYWNEQPVLEIEASWVRDTALCPEHAGVLSQLLNAGQKMERTALRATSGPHLLLDGRIELMNWRVGLLRLWIVATAIWFVLIAVVSWIDYQSGLWSITVYAVLYWAQNTLPDLWGVLILPPLAVLRPAMDTPWVPRPMRTMTAKETGLQYFGEILDRLGAGWELHLQDVDLGRLFDFRCGVRDPGILRRLNIEAIERAREFAREHGCGFVFDEQMVPPTGIFVSAWGPHRRQRD